MRPPGNGPAEGAFDELDASLLEQIGRLFEAVDPVPPDLVDRVVVALELDGLEDELARLDDGLVAAGGARGDEQARTVTFTSDSITAMITISQLGGAATRIDGWVTPSSGVSMEVDGAIFTIRTDIDPDGRFVVEPVPSGRVRFVFSILPPDGVLPRRVVTPAVEL